MRGITIERLEANQGAAEAVLSLALDALGSTAYKINSFGTKYIFEPISGRDGRANNNNRSTKFNVLSAWTQNGVDKIDIL